MLVEKGTKPREDEGEEVDKAEELSQVARSHYTFTNTVKLRKGEKRVLEIPLRPYGI